MKHTSETAGVAVAQQNCSGLLDMFHLAAVYSTLG